MEKIASLILAAAYLMGSVVIPEESLFLPISFCVVPPLMVIWFSAEIGSFLGPQGKGWLKFRSPTRLVSVVAWSLLILLPLFPIASRWVEKFY